MRPSELVTLAVATIKRCIPLLVTGAPGIGKSDLIDQAAKSAGADLILSHPAVADPTDAKGLPFVVTDKKTQAQTADFLPFGELRRAMQATKPTVWFLDDLGQASAAVQASYMQLLLARRVNGHILPDCVTFIAATNRRTDRAGVSGILEPVKSRFGSIVELTPHIDDWCAWAIDHDLPAELIAFLRFKTDLLSAFVPSADLVNCPSPRTWSHVAKLLALGLPSAIQHQAIVGAVGEGAATEFSAFLRLWQELPNVDQILIDPSSVKIPKNPAALYAIAGAVAHKTTKQNFNRVAEFVQMLADDARAEFGVLLLRDAMRKSPDITQTKAFVKFATGDLGQLINGK